MTLYDQRRALILRGLIIGVLRRVKETRCGQSSLGWKLDWSGDGKVGGKNLLIVCTSESLEFSSREIEQKNWLQIGWGTTSMNYLNVGCSEILDVGKRTVYIRRFTGFSINNREVRDALFYRSTDDLVRRNK